METTWDLTPLFPSLESPEFQGAWEDLRRQIAHLKGLLEGETPLDEVLAALDALAEKTTPLSAYLYARFSANTEDEAALAKLSELEMLLLDYERLRPRLTRYLALQEPEEAGPYRILVEEARWEALHLMPEGEEVLSAELSLSGRQAWAKLHENLTSQITATVDGEELPITQVRNLYFRPEEEVRKKAYEAELRAWERHEVPLAYALNGVKGEAGVLNRRRGYRDDLEPTLAQNRITRKALWAMQEAVRESLPLFRRYYLLKARALGKERLDWWDLFAPLGKGRRWTLEEARGFLREKLAALAPNAAKVAEAAFAERWMDLLPRKGKVGGAYCMPRGGGKSLILANYEESFEAVSTLAHELGHAYHNFALARVPASLRHVPMTLAETASIMNETLVVEAALQEASAEEGLEILDAYLQGAAQVVVDIHSRFLFESWVFAKRKERELSPREFKALMLKAQEEAYGEALATRHPYMWAVKGHYYGADFYNYPYTFGLLFGLAVYGQAKEDPAFATRYEDLLAASGLYPAKELAARFGFDLESVDFWRKGLKVLGEKVEALEARL
ncbi:M3 family oligoendopeptidase [Thermus sp.]|uniref:M3 family oligoendopeptidase n=1 Tax=Thermus sp. TaxID=275 RepID=UPI0025DB2340|nr:M3 family oligoendopeptidase [Thermus sp.]MCS6868015.1 M3 family oligoendopeptidase [Thermus sp.]MCX7848659.1 M3 family oligoendopeptidase [Thermus sp.]MDW8016898.1 M3 family oligoendopeptidase [Thermus sp.]MDW8357107.1 M3 family oligoendopeptidase [Thermus sp.]